MHGGHHQQGLDALALARIRAFVAVLSGSDACASPEASASLRHALVSGYSRTEIALWRAPAKGVWRSLNVGQPCNDTAQFWVGTGRWQAHPRWAHCCNKGASIARCPTPLVEAPSRCDAHWKGKALSGRCESDATLLCEPFFASGGASGRGELVYSFGLDGQWEFEDWAGRRGFEVHAFDPTSRSRQRHEAHEAPNVHFHFMGLGPRQRSGASDGHGLALGSPPSPARALGYGEIGGEILALDALAARLGHSRWPIRLLKIDCEGCEWASLADVAARAPAALAQVCTIILEVHLAPRLGMNTTSDLGRMAALWEALIERAAFRVWYVHANPGGFPNEHAQPAEAVHPLLKRWGADPGTCCYEVGLHREAVGCESMPPQPPSSSSQRMPQRS